MQQSFKQVFVTNNPTLLAQGATVDKLAVAQVGIIDSKTSKGVTSPTYATTKAIEFVLGTPDLQDLPLHSGVPNQHIFSKIVKGKAIKGFRGKKAGRGKNQVVTVGFSGDVTDTDTLFAKKGENRRLYITLTGSTIDKLYTKQGITRQYLFESRLESDCEDSCADVQPIEIAEDLVKKINADPAINRFIKASVISDCNPALDPLDSNTLYKFKLVVCDTQDNTALGLVQAQYPDLEVVRIGTEGSSSIYEVVKTVNSAPTAFSNAGLTLIPNCDVCPSGYTKEAAGFVFTAVVEDANADISATIKADIEAAEPTVVATVTKVSNDNYVIVLDNELTVAELEAAIESGALVAGAVVFKYQTTRSICVLTTPSTVSWSANGQLKSFLKKFRITLGDTLCGDNRLAELQAFYPDLTVTIVDADGDCVHTYETEVGSDPVEEGCSVELLKWTKPQAFDGVQWVEVPAAAIPAETVCKAGIKLQAGVINRVTNECTFDKFYYDSDTIHMSVSTFEPDYNAKPNKADWAVKQIQSVQYPKGAGEYVRKLEKESLSYELRERSFDPVVRENEGFEFNAKPEKFYDEYVLDFELETKVGGWSHSYKESYSLHFFFPEAMGKSFETAVNTYLASIGSDIDPVIL